MGNISKHGENDQGGIQPEEAEWLLQSNRLAEEDRFEEALAVFDQAIHDDPTNAVA